MKCKKCRKPIPDESKFCNHCGSPQKKEKMYRRPDGLYEKIMVLNGKRVPFRAKSEKEVLKKVAAYQEKQETGRLFSDVAAEWMSQHFETIAFNTQKSYRPAYQRAVETFEGQHIREIKPNDINSFIGQFSRKGYSQKTVKNQLLVLNLIFTKAVVDGEIEYNPVECIGTPRNLPKHSRELPSDECLQLVKDFVDIEFGLLPFFLLYTGCRIGEALPLRYSDIDFERKIIYISKSVYYENNQPHEKPPKTKAGNREIILLDVLAEKLPRGCADTLLFPGDNGGVMTYSCFKHRWNAYCKTLGIYHNHDIIDKDGYHHAKIAPNLTPHQLRHGFATILFEAGIDEKDAMELMGHTTIAVMRDTYTHIRKTRKEQTAQRLNEYAANDSQK